MLGHKQSIHLVGDLGVWSSLRRGRVGQRRQGDSKAVITWAVNDGPKLTP
jgi:hypothetical protein